MGKNWLDSGGGALTGARTLSHRRAAFAFACGLATSQPIWHTFLHALTTPALTEA
jgi:hypothetical protein